MIRRILMLAMALGLAAAARGAALDLTVTSGTVTCDAASHDAFGRDSNLVAVRWAWTSDAAGRVVARTDRALFGTIARVVTNPGGTAPTDDYDITVTDDDGADVLAGKGSNRDTANTEQVVPLIGDGTTTQQPVAVGSRLTLNITNAGNAKVGEFIVYLRRN